MDGKSCFDDVGNKGRMYTPISSLTCKDRCCIWGTLLYRLITVAMSPNNKVGYDTKYDYYIYLLELTTVVYKGFKYKIKVLL